MEGVGVQSHIDWLDRKNANKIIYKKKLRKYLA